MPWPRGLLRAGAAGSSPGVLGGPQPDLSSGSDNDVDPEPDHPAQTAAVTYSPPRGMSPDEMSDFLTDVVPMLHPSSVAAMLSGPTPDLAAAYWLQVIAHLQRRMAATLHNVINDASVAGRDIATFLTLPLRSLRIGPTRPWTASSRTEGSTQAGPSSYLKTVATLGPCDCN